METEGKPTLYLETSIVSYLTRRPSRDVIVLAHQQTTREFWKTRRREFEIYISQVVLREAERGNPRRAAERIAHLSSFEILPVTPDVAHLAQIYLKEAAVPQKAYLP